MLVAYTHSLWAKLGLSELRLGLETCGLRLHGRELLCHLGHQAILLLLREAPISSSLGLLELLILLLLLLLHLEFL